MGVANNISKNQFPIQGNWLNKRTKVCFNYDLSVIIMGTIIRDDLEKPYVTIILLDNGRVVLATECMHSPQ
jgi:hypothetical protein